LWAMLFLSFVKKSIHEIKNKIMSFFLRYLLIYCYSRVIQNWFTVSRFMCSFPYITYVHARQESLVNDIQFEEICVREINFILSKAFVFKELSLKL